MAYTWDEQNGIYRDEAGDPVPVDEVIAAANESLSESRDESDRLAEMIAAGLIAAAMWAERMREVILLAYIRLYVAGIGGLGRMTAADWQTLGGLLDEQYARLEDFRRQAKNMTPAAIRARARMYVASARGALETARSRAAARAGRTQERWYRTKDESCDDCITNEGAGWQKLGTFPMPGDGSTQCLTNCGCYKVYR